MKSSIGDPAELLLQPFVELLRIGDLAVRLNLRHMAVQVGVDVDVQFLGFLHQQQLVDLIAQRIRGLLIDSVIERLARQGLLLDQFFSDHVAPLCKLAAGNDLAVHFCHDLFHQVDLRVGPVGRKHQQRRTEKKSQKKSVPIHM